MTKAAKAIEFQGFLECEEGGLETETTSGDVHDLPVNKADREGGLVQNTTLGDPSETPKDHSRTNPRSGLIAALTSAIAEGMAVGDATLVQVSAAALATLAQTR